MFWEGRLVRLCAGVYAHSIMVKNNDGGREPLFDIFFFASDV